MSAITCRTCRTDVHPLEVFPGEVCLTCWADSPQGRYMPTADELTAMFRGAVR